MAVGDVMLSKLVRILELPPQSSSTLIDDLFSQRRTSAFGATQIFCHGYQGALKV